MKIAGRLIQAPVVSKRAAAAFQARGALAIVGGITTPSPPRRLLTRLTK